jgi:rhodanese-related sulfurtransferase
LQQASFVKFVIDNIWLIVAMVVSGAVLIWPELRKLIGGSDELGTLQIVQLINHKNAIVLDVREGAEYAQGHIPNAKHIPLSELDKRVKELDKFKQRPIIVSCQAGTRSASASRILKKHQFGAVYLLKGGIGAWQQANLPVEK